METYCTGGGRSSKFHQSIAGNSFYHTDTYGNNFRDEYSFVNSTRNSALLWHKQSHPSNAKNRGRMCSIALVATAFVVLLAVLSIGGLALYMGALMSDSSTYLVTYNCNAKVMRGDRFLGALHEKAKRYKSQIHSLYQRSVLGSSLVSTSFDHFGNDTFTIFYKVTLNRRKLSHQMHNMEKIIKDILLTDGISKKPIFRNVRFDPHTVNVQQSLMSESSHQRVHKYNEPSPSTSVSLPKSKLANMVLKATPIPNQTSRMNMTVTAELPFKKKPIVEEPIIHEENLPVIHGSFIISKTDADITLKKHGNISTTTTTTTTIKPKNTISEARHPSTRETSVISALYKIVASDKSLASTTELVKLLASTTVTHPPVVSSTSAMQLTTITSSPTSVSNVVQFSFSPSVFNQEPWVPIYKEPVPNVPPTTAPNIPATLFHQAKPFYTSFTNPGLTYHSADIQELGSTSVKGHPIPVNKIHDIIESVTSSLELDSNTEDTNEKISSETIVSEANGTETVELETLGNTSLSPPSIVSIGNDTYSKWELISGTSESEAQDAQGHSKNISTIFNTLPSIFNKPEILLNFTKDNTNETNSINDDSDELVAVTEEIETVSEISDQISGQGQVEVVDVEEVASNSETTKSPLVTLLPVKSNSGVGRPIRPRPILSETRSFGKKPPADNIFESKDTTNRMTTNSMVGKKPPPSDFNIVGLLNFQTESAIVHLDSSSVISESHNANRDPKLESDLSNATRFHDEVAVLNISSTGADQSKVHYLSSQDLKELSEISKISNNNNNRSHVPSTKAVYTGHSINDAFKTLTKVLNKIPASTKDYHSDHFESFSFSAYSNNTECSNFTIICGDGQCLPQTSKCNQLIDCTDGADEKNCSCSDYLRSQFLLRKICDGVVDCWDFSDEKNCDWCTPGQYVCGNSKVCIDRNNICDGVRDCPYGDDEKQCVTVSPNINDADEFPYHHDGYLMVRKYGQWGKLCVDNFMSITSETQTRWEISDLGKAVCKAMTYQNLDTVNVISEEVERAPYFELVSSEQSKMAKSARTKSGLSFEATSCGDGKVAKVRCLSLECGTRPQAIKSEARIVGGGNAGIGAWPWQAALYKEGEFQCGATLISDKWLISAGHCFYHTFDEYWVARLGALRRGTSLPSPYEHLRSIVDIVIHPGYVNNGFINDIALLRMARLAVFSDYVRPICLPLKSEAPVNGQECTVIGWGQLFEVGRIFPDTLQEVQVPVISTAECRKHTVFLPLYRVTDDMFCAGFDRGGRDACLGDSGGPLMCPQADGRWQLHGITSNGYGCARANRPGVYTKVANYVEWIDDVLKNMKERNITSGATCHGHRCPLGKCLPKNRICNGFIECSDGSDEVECL